MKNKTSMTVWLSEREARSLKTIARKVHSTRHRLVQRLLHEEVKRNRKPREDG